jgi:serine/threonine-protein kinase
VHEIDEAEERAFIAMEYVEGESLAAKIMDFGPAHPEEATRITQTGTSVGTPAYMSPEQVRGEHAGHRTDIWSLGVVLYEMVTGRLPFPGDVPEAISHAVLYENPEPLTALRTSVPIELDWIVGKCLAKEPGQRYQHADEMWVDLKTLRRKLESGSATVVTPPPPAATPAPEKRHRSCAVPVLGTLLALNLAALLALWFRSPDLELPVRRFAYSPAPDITDPVISPDGRHIAYTAENKLWVLDLQTGEPRAIDGTDGAVRPFWTQDGLAIAFAGTVNSEIKPVALTGGRPLRICQKPPTAFSGGSFSGKGDSLLYGRFGGGLHWCQSATGTEPLSAPELLMQVQANAPHFLPTSGDRQALLFFEGGTEASTILLYDLDSGDTRMIGKGAFPVYSSSEHILYQTSQTEHGIWALPFSLGSLEVTGEAFSVADHGVRPSVARNGTLVFLDTEPSRPKQLVWRDRAGKNIEAISQPQQDMQWVALSPDEDRVAVTGIQGDNEDIWIHDIELQVKTRLTTDPRRDVKPAWSPSGDQIAFTSVGRNSFVVATVPSSEPQNLFGIEAGWVDDWSADGKRILLGAMEQLSYVELDDQNEDLELVPVLRLWTRDARLSPDGRYVAYSNPESGEFEIYVCDFPGGGNRTQVSTGGGVYQRWGRDGKELFYVDDGMLVAVPVTTTPRFEVTGAPEKLFPVEEQGGYTYDVSADGQRFVVIEPVGEAVPPVIRVVQNWAAEFEDR